VVVALVSLVAVAALAAALFLLRSTGELKRAVEAARGDTARAEAARAALQGEHDQLRATARALSDENARAAHEVRQARGRADELAMLLEAATASRSDADDGEGLWRLLLAHVTRRWAAVVGVPPDGRAIHAGDPDEQLLQALARETERLREEVGVDVELSPPAGGSPAAAGADPTDRVAVLVAALEVLGALASTAQRVTVDIGDTLVLTGEGWVDPYGEVAAAHERSTGAGVVLGPLETGEEQVRLVMHHRPAVTASSARG
jgi:hypothetical protein